MADIEWRNYEGPVVIAGFGKMDSLGRAKWQRKIDALDARMRDAERAMSDQIARDMFPVPEGPMPFVPAPPRWTRARRWLSGRSLAAREWLAVHVLRIEVAGDDDQEGW